MVKIEEILAGKLYKGRVKNACDFGAILTGPHAANYHARRIEEPLLFIHPSPVEMYFDISFDNFNLFYKKMSSPNAPDFVTGVRKHSGKKEEVPMLVYKDGEIILFPSYRPKINHVQHDGIKISDIDATISHLSHWPGRHSKYAIYNLRRIKRGQKPDEDVNTASDRGFVLGEPLTV